MTDAFLGQRGAGLINGGVEELSFNRNSTDRIVRHHDALRMDGGIPMGCDMMLARGTATAARQTLLGINLFDVGRQRLHLHSLAPASHPLDAVIRLSQLTIPQARHTHAVFGVQTENAWGLLFGCNDQHVAVGVARWRSRLPQSEPGLSGPELARLTLERSRSALQAVETLTDLISRHGQRDADDLAAHAVFLIADANEGCVLEVASTHWALLECSQTRAVTDAGLIRQDWKRLSPGLAEQAICNGWWTEDGAKLDFAGSLGVSDPEHAWGLKRWSRATLSLAQRHGGLDLYSMRRLLAEQQETCVRRHELAPRATRHLGSLVAQLDAPALPLVWLARAPVETPLYFPLVVGADLPAHLGAQAELPSLPQSRVERLQKQFDQEAQEYLAEAQELHQRGESAARARLAQAMMIRHAEQWDSAGSRRIDSPAAALPRPNRAEEEMTPFAFG